MFFGGILGILLYFNAVWCFYGFFCYFGVNCWFFLLFWYIFVCVGIFLFVVRFVGFTILEFGALFYCLDGLLIVWKWDFGVGIRRKFNSFCSEFGFSFVCFVIGSLCLFDLILLVVCDRLLFLICLVVEILVC